MKAIFFSPMLLDRIRGAGADRRWVADGILLLVCLAATVLTAATIYQVSKIYFWSHDDLIYVPNLNNKLRSEGRWLNNVFFPLIHPLPGIVCWLIGFSSVFYFFFALSREYTRNVAVAWLIAVLSLQYPGFYALWLWPGGMAPAAIVLAMAPALSRRLPMAVFMPLFGILLFATYPTFYFLLPLLFLRRGDPPIVASWAKSAFLACLWASGFLLGYLVAATLNIFLVGEFGIRLAAWREPNFVTDFASFFENIASRLAYIVKFFADAFPNPYLDAAIILLFAFSLYCMLAERPRREAVLSIIFCTLIILAQYAMTVPSGIVIENRSLHQVFAGVVFLIVSVSIHRWQNLVVIGSFSLIGLAMWAEGYDAMAWYSEKTQIIYRDLAEAAPGPPAGYARLLVDSRGFPEYWANVERSSRNSRMSPFLESPASPSRWVRAATEMGFLDAVMCPTLVGDPLTPLCTNVLAQFASDQCLNRQPRICVLGETGGTLVIRLTP
jgi:hypothetical protein